MSNINPTPGPKPTLSNPIKELQAATTAASTTVGLDAALRSFLIKQFGTIEGNKICDKVMASIPKDKIGKNLSFDVVKKAMLDATEKDPEKNQKLKDLFSTNEAPENKTDDDPFKFIKEAIRTIQESQSARRKSNDKHADTMTEAQNKTIEQNKEEVKKQEIKKLINPDKLV